MKLLSSTQHDQIDKAIRELDPLSQAKPGGRSAGEYDGLRNTIIDLLESHADKFNLTRAVSEKIGMMGVQEDSVDVVSFITKVLKIAGRPDAE